MKKSLTGFIYLTNNIYFIKIGKGKESMFGLVDIVMRDSIKMIRSKKTKFKF